MERLQDLFYSLPQRRLIFLPLSSLTNNILTQTSGLMPHPWHIYTCLQVGGTKGWSGSIDVGTWTTKAVNIWLWSSDVLGNARTSISLSKRSWLYACILHACLVQCFLPRSPTLSMPSILLVALIFSLLAGPSNLILPQLVKKKKFSADLKWRCPNMHLTSMYGCLHEVCSSNLAHGKNPGWIHIRTNWAYRRGGRGSFRTKYPNFENLVRTKLLISEDSSFGIKICEDYPGSYQGFRLLRTPA